MIEQLLIIIIPAIGTLGVALIGLATHTTNRYTKVSKKNTELQEELFQMRNQVDELTRGMRSLRLSVKQMQEERDSEKALRQHLETSLERTQTSLLKANEALTSERELRIKAQDALTKAQETISELTNRLEE